MALAAAEPRIELLSADSMQVYRGMDIGTAKPTVAEQAAVRHHLIDLLDPHQGFSVSDFAEAAQACASEVVSRGGIPVLVGGTGLYVRSVVDTLDIPGKYPDTAAEIEAEPDTSKLFARLAALDPVAADRMEPENRRRIVRALEVCIGSGRLFSSHGPGLSDYPKSPIPQVGCDRPRASLDDRIAARYDTQMQAGFLEEVTALHDAEEPLSRTAAQALGYKELLMHLRGEVSIDEALQLANQRTRRFARRQQRWYRRDPRIDWLDLDDTAIENCVDRCLAHMGEC